MRELPILFSTPMVKAILEGRKTQTRRVCPGARELSRAADWPIERAPYRVGDRLWVRETFAVTRRSVSYEYPDDVYFFAWDEDTDGKYDKDSAQMKLFYREEAQLPAEFEMGEIPWRPSIHMPKWATRLWLEVTEVRVQRLQEITEADAAAEGVQLLPAILSFSNLWDSLNGKTHPWESNPWVWCYSFKRLGRREQEVR